MNAHSSNLCELLFLCRNRKSWVALFDFFLVLPMPGALGFLSFPWQPDSKMQGWLWGFMLLRASELIPIENPVSCFLGPTLFPWDSRSGSSCFAHPEWCCVLSRYHPHFWVWAHIIMCICVPGNGHQREVQTILQLLVSVGSSVYPL